MAITPDPELNGPGSLNKRHSPIVACDVEAAIYVSKPPPNDRFAFYCTLLVQQAYSNTESLCARCDAVGRPAYNQV